MDKFNNSGLSSFYVTWFQSYLSSGSFSSSHYYVLPGVLQGSNFGHLSFSVFITDLFAKINYYTILLFDDDSKIHAIHIKIFIDCSNSVPLDWINKHTISLWLYKSPRRSRHVVTCSRQSVSCLQTVEVQGCLFQKWKEFSLSNTTWHLVLN
jgi:hypothetical protein